MATRYIEKMSKKVSDSIIFTWKIKDLAFDELPNDERRIRSSTFKCLKAVFCLEIARISGNIHLYLTQSNKSNPPWISECTIGLTYSDKCDKHFKQFSTPTKPADITCYFTASAIKKDLPDNVLSVCCNFTASTVMQNSDDESETESDEDEDEIEFSKSGPLVLAEDIGKAIEPCRHSDVTLKVGKNEFQAHKIILASRSKVFDAMFESDMKENRQNAVDIIQMKPSIAKEMLLYIYTGKVERLSMDRALDLYVAADRYDLQELKEWCQRFVQKHVSPKDVCQVAELAELHNDKKLAKTVRRVFKEESQRILISKEWRDFAEKNPVLYSNLMEGALLNKS
ncbi:TD and POZ domain-containing protein 1-like [Uloborus diversus]|uniref:TD and POZ domain-containing protein 1-like n=1 Tax=Uloborus diversus TaxID=327109 RepID=UPI00240919E3|nr:TD and POZ domain-containing protein 1-like [Uloborus diversus]